MTTVFILSGTTYTIPAGVTSIDAQAIGGGASGGATGKFGGGGGEWRKQNAITVTPGASVTIQIGAGGVYRNASSADWSGQAGTPTSFVNTSTLKANPGLGAAGSAAGGTGGTGANGNFNGGAGGAGGFLGGGGAGAGGPQGAGGAGGASVSGGGHGGAGDTVSTAAIGGQGGDTGNFSFPGTAGGAGSSFGSGKGAGGGGGGATFANAGDGGNYGGGGGGLYQPGALPLRSGAGAQGILVLTFTASGASGSFLLTNRGMMNGMDRGSSSIRG